MKFDERNPTISYIPLFLLPWQLRKVCPTDSDFFGLSRSTRCACCSYQVSSISVRRVTCYDNFCVFFNFSAFWPFPWQRQPFWKNKHLKTQLSMAYDIPTRFHKVWSRHLREKGRTKLGGKWNNKNNNNNSDCHCKAIADITPPHYFGTSVSMVPPFWIFQHAKSFHTLRWIFLRCFMKFDDRNQNFV
jgi:hypothetical protein